MPPSRQRFAAGFVLYDATPIGRRYLLLRNARHGTWGFPKGHRDGDENDLACAHRELEEETGLSDVTVDPEFRVVVRYVVNDRGQTFEKVTTYHLARLVRGDLRLSPEHTEALWVDPETAIDVLGFDTLRDVIERAEDHLGREVA